MSSGGVFKVREVTLFTHGHAALNAVSFEVKRGEIIGIIGPNYSGKSTLLSALAGGFRHLEGECRISTYSLSTDPKHYKSLLGYASPTHSPEEYLTGLEWLELVGTAYHLPPKKRIADILRLADQLEAKEDLYRVLEQVSPAGRQKISLIASLFHEPTVALWDEPTQYLDPITQHELLGVARSFVGEGGSLVIAANHLEWLEQVADRYLCMDHGEILTVGTLAELRNEHRAKDRSLKSVFEAVFHE